jgi:hypothetical protein
MNELRVILVLLLLGSTSFCQKTDPSLKTLSSPAPDSKPAFRNSACQPSQTPWSIDGLTSSLVTIPRQHASGVHAIPLSQTPNVYLHRIPRNFSCRQINRAPAVPVDYGAQIVDE